MKLGLIGVNPITQIIVHIQKAMNQNVSLCIYDDDLEKIGKEYCGVTVVSDISKIEDDYFSVSQPLKPSHFGLKV